MALDKMIFGNYYKLTSGAIGRVTIYEGDVSIHHIGYSDLRKYIVTDKQGNTLGIYDNQGNPHDLVTDLGVYLGTWPEISKFNIRSK